VKATEQLVTYVYKIKINRIPVQALECKSLVQRDPELLKEIWRDQLHLEALGAGT
jgi:hypothetical protein